MAWTRTDPVGFNRMNPRDLEQPRYAASLELLASVALVVSIAVAATVVSIGIARAGTLGPWHPADDAGRVVVWLGAGVVLLGGVATWLLREFGVLRCGD